jgi:hypothetical protein
MSRTLGRFLLLVVASSAYLLVAGEVLYRFVDGYRFDVAVLTPRSSTGAAPSDDHAAERALLEEARVDRQIDPDLFFSPPAVLDKPANPEIAERSRVNTDLTGQENYVWNDAFLRDLPQAQRDALDRQKSDVVFAFRSYDGSIHPIFRLYPDTQSTLGTTNHFGWLSPDIAADKPSGTIRIAIIGDSTSHNTMGLYLQGFLNAWSERTNAPYRLEVLNTARQGLGQEDFINVLKYEIAPVTPDYVILTAGSAVFFNGKSLWSAEQGVDTEKATLRFSWFNREAHSLLKEPERWSALGRHILQTMDNTSPDGVEREPPKPIVKLNPPFNMTGPPTLADARTFPWYRSFLDALDKLKAISADEHIIPIVTTDRACAYPGMAVNRRINPYLFDGVNGPTYWPLAYRQIQHILRFNNQVIERWAVLSGVNVIDVEGMVPKKPELCSDVQHDLPLGQRLRSWLIFQKMVGIIEADASAGRVPRPGSGRDSHPAFAESVLRLNRLDVLAGRKHAPSD